MALPTEQTGRMLGYAGLIPFAALAVEPMIRMLPEGIAAMALLAYGAVILSFLGGIIWGRMMRDGGAGVALIVSNAISLAGWVALLIGGAGGLLLLAAAFAATLAYDLGSDLPHWFRRLRVHLTAGAVASTLLAAVIS